jgi:AraC-like DNA-binding protein
MGEDKIYSFDACSCRMLFELAPTYAQQESQMTKGEFTILRCSAFGVNAVASNTRHVFPRHTHEQYGIGVIKHGAQKSFSGRGIVEAGPGDTITVNPGEVHDGRPIRDTSRSWHMLYFNPSIVAEAVHDMTEGKTRDYEFHHPVINDARIAICFQQLFSAYTTVDEPDVLRREELLLSLLRHVIAEENYFVVKDPMPKSICIAKRLIDDRSAAPITLSDLARASGLSQFRLLRGFVKATGLTPHAYLVQRRIEMARRLMADGVGLAEAAVASGFADQSHMTRIFVHKYGISPGAYARAMN